jgi:[acyl-carrier-protein] S-malonyltransferase
MAAYYWSGDFKIEDKKEKSFLQGSDMAERVIFLFPGQGSQFPGMALDLYEKSAAVRELFERASCIWKKDVKKMIAESDAETLKKTDVAQVCITTANLAALICLAEQGVTPAAAAGHSLGEYAALCVSGIIGIDACLTLVAARGEAMNRAVNEAAEPCAMAAVIGLAPERVMEIVAALHKEQAAVYAANYNSAKQTVLSGTKAALEAAQGRFKDAGARRFLLLPVAGAFHSPLMAKAAEEFAPVLDGVVFREPRIPFFSNVSGKAVRSAAEAKKLAVLQITSPVRWTEIEDGLAALEPEAVIEAGPGKVLTGLWKERGGEIVCRGY